MIHGMVNIGTGIYFDSIQRFQFRPELSFGFDFNFDTRGVQSPYVAQHWKLPPKTKIPQVLVVPSFFRPGLYDLTRF